MIHSDASGQGSIAPNGQPAQHPVRFTGSGSEYFRIWIVNLLLTVITLGIYYPWAKVRKLKYFYTNTEVAGHALDFHGEPKAMLRGYVLMAALLAVYSFAGKASEWAGALAGLALAALWPVLIRASLQFRLANTSWRGLRFTFMGSLKEAYLVFAMPMLGLLGLVIVGGALTALLGKAVGPAAAGAAGVAMVLGAYALMPYVYYRFKAYQHGNLALADWQTKFRAKPAEVLGVFVKTVGVMLLTFAAGGVLAGTLVGILGVSPLTSGTMASPKAVLAFIPVIFVLMISLQIVVVPYFQSRMQNLVWSQTGNRDLRFKSELRFGPLARQTALNWVLMVLTLGLYWPFAKVAIARLKLEAITLSLRSSPDALVTAIRPAYREGAGDAAADLAGVDFGL